MLPSILCLTSKQLNYGPKYHTSINLSIPYQKYVGKDIINGVFIKGSFANTGILKCCSLSSLGIFHTLGAMRHREIQMDKKCVSTLYWKVEGQC